MPAKKRNSAATRQSVTNPAAIQQERAEILAVLLDDAGKDWKPRKKGTTQHRAATAPAKQTQASKPSPVTLTPAQQREQQQILSILLDDAGKDWKPRVKGTRPASQGRGGGKAPAGTKTPPAKTARPASAKPKQAPTPLSSVKPKSPAQLTAAQKLEQQQILSILLDDAGKDWKPRDKSRTSSPSDTHTGVGKSQHKPQQAKQSPKQAQKPAPKQAPAHKSAPAKPLTPAQQREQLEILSILIDFKEPPAKVAPKQAAKPAPAAHNKPTQGKQQPTQGKQQHTQSKPTPAKTQTKSQPVQHKPQPVQNKSQPTQNKQNVQPTKHIVKNQPRGVKMTT